MRVSTWRRCRRPGRLYFDGRAATIKKIQDPALQAQAQERLTASQRGFDGVLTSLRQTRESLDPVRKELGDQVKYLESDLSPSGTASLKPQAEKTKAGASVVFTKLAVVTSRFDTGPALERVLHRLRLEIDHRDGAVAVVQHQRRLTIGRKRETHRALASRRTACFPCRSATSRMLM